MARKVDGTIYPDETFEILRNAETGPAFQNYLKSRHVGKKVEFLEDVLKRANRLAKSLFWRNKTAGIREADRFAKKRKSSMSGEQIAGELGKPKMR